MATTGTCVGVERMATVALHGTCVLRNKRNILSYIQYLCWSPWADNLFYFTPTKFQLTVDICIDFTINKCVFTPHIVTGDSIVHWICGCGKFPCWKQLVIWLTNPHHTSVRSFAFVWEIQGVQPPYTTLFNLYTV